MAPDNHQHADSCQGCSYRRGWLVTIWRKNKCFHQQNLTRSTICYSCAARIAIQAGAAGIIVSNHGARQLDYVPATISALEEVRSVWTKYITLYSHETVISNNFSSLLLCSGCQSDTRTSSCLLGRWCSTWNWCLQGSCTWSLRDIRKHHNSKLPQSCLKPLTVLITHYFVSDW